MKALSIRQPWAHAIVHLGKRIENRSWSTDYRGPLFIHASKGTGSLGDFTDDCDALADILQGGPEWVDFRDAHLDVKMYRHDSFFVPRASLLRGGIVGVARLVDVIEPTGQAPEGVDDRWLSPSQCGFVLADVRAVAFREVKGELGFFDVADGAEMQP